MISLVLFLIVRICILNLISCNLFVTTDAAFIRVNNNKAAVNYYLQNNNKKSLLLSRHDCNTGHRRGNDNINKNDKRKQEFLTPRFRSSSSSLLLAAESKEQVANDKDGDDFSHKDITWKISLDPEISLLKKIKWKLSCKWIRFMMKISKKKDDATSSSSSSQEFLIMPKGKALLEAYYFDSSSNNKRRIGRFGITTESGPPALPIQETVQELYGIETLVSSGAIIYMFIEPEFRSRQLGKLALEIISYLHSYQRCDFTLLVADDNGSGKLIQWYETYGFQRAPKLQTILGSPNEKYGVTMIAPANGIRPNHSVVKWW